MSLRLVISRGQVIRVDMLTVGLCLLLRAIFSYYHSSVAHSVEHPSDTRKARGSIPLGRTLERRKNAK